jgi:transcriptional regulator with XRE-family HTH domain
MGWLRSSRQAASYDLAADVPVERLAHLLRRARVRAGLDDRALAKQLGVRLKDVLAWECGDDRPDDTVLERYASICNVTIEDLLRRRDVVEVDLRRGTMRVGTSVARFDWQLTSNAAVLHTYVGLVREQRNLRPDQPVRFRDDDVESLSAALDLTDVELESRFVQIVGLSPQEAADVRMRMLHRRLAGPSVVPSVVPSVAVPAAVAPSGAPAVGPAPSAPGFAPPPPSSFAPPAPQVRG